MGQALPSLPWHQAKQGEEALSLCTHLQLLPGQDQCGSTGTGGASETLVTRTMLVTLAAVHEAFAMLPAPLIVPAASCPHSMAWHSVVGACC